jgi:hypothetical protein
MFLKPNVETANCVCSSSPTSLALSTLALYSCKVATENHFPESLYIRDEFVEGHHDGQPPKQQNKYSDHDQAPYRYRKVVLIPISFFGWLVAA